MIVGRDLMLALGMIIDFKYQVTRWDNIGIPMNRKITNKKELNAVFEKSMESTVVKEATNRVTRILDATYERADLNKIIETNCKHLSSIQQKIMLNLLKEFEPLFDGTLGTFRTNPVDLELIPGSKSKHFKAFPVPKIHERTLKKEIDRLVKLGVLRKCSDSTWAAPTFIIPKKNGTVRFISDFRYLNKCLVRKPYPIPKIADILQKLEGIKYATSLDLNMGYYTVQLSTDASRLCTIITQWGKYQYLRLPMGVNCSPDLFQEKMSDLMEGLEYVRTYLDDLLVLGNTTFEDHINQLRTVLRRLQKAGLKVNVEKSSFCSHKIEYLGYLLTAEGIRPTEDKVKAILELKEPTTLRELRRVLGMVQYYRDLWKGRSHILAPLTDLVGKSKKKLKWTDEHQQAFNNMKKTIARETILAYPDFSKPFDVHTDASDRQLGAVISQGGKPLAFYSRKLNSAQRNYTTTERELLSIVETLKEFRNILLGQKIKVYTDHKNLVHETTLMSSQRVMRWRLLLEEYGPDIVYIKGTDNIIADALSRIPIKGDSETEKTPKKCKSNKETQHLDHLNTVVEVFSQKNRRYRSVPDDDDEIKIINPIKENVNHLLTLENILANNEENQTDVYPIDLVQVESLQRRDRNLRRTMANDPERNYKRKCSNNVLSSFIRIE